MVKQERVEESENGSEETPEQAEVSKQLKEMAKQELQSPGRQAWMPEGVEPFNPKKATEELLSNKKTQEIGPKETPEEKKDRIIRWNKILNALGDNLSMTVEGGRVTISENGEVIGNIFPFMEEVKELGISPDKDFQEKAQEMVEWGWRGKSGGVRRKK